MKKLFLLLALLGGIVGGINAIGQTITNNTNCTIIVEYSCYNPNIPGCWYTTPTAISVSPLTTVVYSPSCTGTDLMLHFYFKDCPSNDPFVAQIGNCLSLPDTDIMYSTNDCDCPESAIISCTNTANDDWEVN